MSQLRFYFVFRLWPFLSPSNTLAHSSRTQSSSHHKYDRFPRSTNTTKEGAQSVLVSSLMFRLHVCQIKRDVLVYGACPGIGNSKAKKILSTNRIITFFFLLSRVRVLLSYGIRVYLPTLTYLYFLAFSVL